MADSWLQAEAKAKVNLRLRIFPRGPDGYHPLETLFCRIDLSDRLRVRRRGEAGVAITVGGSEAAPDGPDNLAVRAALAVIERSRLPGGVEIELEKHIPAGTGLGGGSSDAAAVLRLLARHLDPLLPGQDVLRLASELGADVAFFAADLPLALGRGRGDRLLPGPSLQPRPMLVVVPQARVSTAKAYAAWDALHDPAHSVAPAEIDWTALNRWDEIRDLAENDFEPVVFGRHPELRRLKDTLEDTGPLFALLSGSGSSLFAVYANREGRAEAAQQLEGVEGVRVISAHGPV